MSLMSRFRGWRNRRRQRKLVASIARNEPALPRFVPAPPKRKGGITSALLQELAALLRIPTKKDPAFNRTLKMVKPFPGVVPAGTPTMAVDSQISGALTFARGQGFGEDFGFLGYALLSELMRSEEHTSELQSL